MSNLDVALSQLVRNSGSSGIVNHTFVLRKASHPDASGLLKFAPSSKPVLPSSCSASVLREKEPAVEADKEDKEIIAKKLLKRRKVGRRKYGSHFDRERYVLSVTDKAASADYVCQIVPSQSSYIVVSCGSQGELEVAVLGDVLANGKRAEQVGQGTANTISSLEEAESALLDRETR